MMKRHALLALALAAAGFSNTAAADESICFINKSDHGFTFFYPYYQAVFVLDPNVGDTNTCVDVPMLNGNGVEDDTAASYYEPRWQVDNISFSLDNTYLIQGPNIRPFTTISEVAGLAQIQPVFLNPVIGEGTFYWANKWRNSSGRELDGDITWQEGDLWCTVEICFSHQRGDDGIYRVVLDENELEMPQPAGAAPNPPPPDEGIDPWEDGGG